MISKVPQTIRSRVVVGILLFSIGSMSMVRKFPHGNLPINGLATKLPKFPPLPEIKRVRDPNDDRMHCHVCSELMPGSPSFCLELSARRKVQVDRKDVGVKKGEVRIGLSDTAAAVCKQGSRA